MKIRALMRRGEEVVLRASFTGMYGVRDAG